MVFMFMHPNLNLKVILMKKVIKNFKQLIILRIEKYLSIINNEINLIDIVTILDTTILFQKI